MPMDTRRFNGPENSVPYKHYTKDFYKTYEQLSSELLGKDNLRKDGRKCSEKRAVHVSTGIIPQAKGSAYVEVCKTKLIVAVYDPREIPHQNEYSSNGQLFCEFKMAPFSSKRVRRSYAPDAEEKELSAALKKALEPAVCLSSFPNFQIDILVYVIENDGSCLSAAINGASLALCNAAVQMYDVVTATTIGIDNDRKFPDPTEEEEYVCGIGGDSDTRGNHGVVILSKMNNQNQVTDVIQKGSMDYECLTDALDILDKDCSALLPILQRRLVLDVDKAANCLHPTKIVKQKKQALHGTNVLLDEY